MLLCLINFVIQFGFQIKLGFELLQVKNNYNSVLLLFSFNLKICIWSNMNV